jgi:MFS family permease
MRARTMPRRRLRRFSAGEFRHGWPVVLASFAAAVFAWGFAAFGPAVYLVELRRAHGWPAAGIGAATSLSFLVGAGLLPWVGAAIERFGPRFVLSGGLMLIGVGVVGISRVTSLWQLYPADLVVGCGWAGASSTAISTILARRFDRRRGLALSLALSGASAGGFAVAPALVGLSRWHGFRAAVPELAALLLAMILPLVWCGASRAATSPLAPAAGRPGALPVAVGRRAMLREARFWSIAAPFALAISAQVGMMVVEVGYLLPLLGPAGTSFVLMATSIAAALGRLGLSPAIDRLDQRRVGALTFAIQAAALILMIAYPGDPPLLYLGSILFGLCMGNVVALPSLIIQREFAPESFGTVLGLSTAVGQIAYAISPTALGAVRDLTGGYRASLMVCIALQLTAALTVLRRRTTPSSRRPAISPAS